MLAAICRTLFCFALPWGGENGRMIQSGKTTSPRRAALGSFGWLAAVLCGVLAVLFWRVLDPSWVLFANDGPLGAMMADRGQLPATFSGAWSDLNGYGVRESGAAPDITNGLFWLLGPLGFSKIYAPITLLILGAGAWFLFRQLGLGTVAPLLGGLAAALAPDFFCVSCWGVGPQAICFGLNYAAMGIVVSPRPLPPWIRYPLAGLAVGMGVMEAFDIGAIFSVFTALFVVVHALTTSQSAVKGLVQGGVRAATIAVFAGFLAAVVLSNLIETQIKGIVGTGQDAQTKEEQWDKATWGSFPKSEVAGLLVPGLFGYRMMGSQGAPGAGSLGGRFGFAYRMTGMQGAPEDEAYWGKGGRDPSWDRYLATGKTGPPPHGPLRWGGGGSYVGVLVAIIAFWAFLQSFRKENSVFNLNERKFIWYWTGIAFVCLLLSFGRNAPFYRILYALPGISTIRIPAKFIHVLEWALLIVFAYGVHGLARRCMEAPAAAARGLVSQLQSWWARASAFDKRWVKGSAMVLGGCAVGWLVYFSSRNSLVAYLQEVQFDATAAEAIASFSVSQVGWFVLLLAIALGLFTLVLSGYFSGRRALVGTVLLALFLVVDLTRVGARWVVTYNWKDRYLEAADNGVIEFLRTRPFEHRVTLLPLERLVDWGRLSREAPQLVQQYSLLAQLYGGEWVQHLFQYYNIQSPNVVQEPRMAVDKAAFEAVMAFAPLRHWELANTRYILGLAGLYNFLNTEVDPQRRFQPVMLFEFYQTQAGGPILTRTNAAGPFALFDFAGALPRAKLYSNWAVSTNDPVVLQAWVKGLQARVPLEWRPALAAQSPADLATLHELAEPAFDPAQTVLLAERLPAPAPAGTNQNAGEVKFESYAPKHIALRVKAESPAVLLLNDKYDPNWKVFVDGKAAPLLRCNYIMRGVHLERGEHTVEFRFEPPHETLYVSLAAIGLGGVLLGVLAVGARRRSAASPPQARKTGKS
jgi:hypothetical protein